MSDETTSPEAPPTDSPAPHVPEQAEEITPTPVQPVPEQPPEQEHQAANPEQEAQTTVPTSATPAAQQVSGPAPALVQPDPKANEGEEADKEADKPKITLGTSIGDLIKDAFFTADNLGEPEVSSDNPRQIHLYFPVDESMVIIRLEGRPGRWQGLSPIAHSDQDRKRANKHFDDQKKILEDRQKTARDAAQQESHDDATARRESKPESVNA